LEHFWRGLASTGMYICVYTPYIGLNISIEIVVARMAQKGVKKGSSKKVLKYDILSTHFSTLNGTCMYVNTKSGDLGHIQ